MKKIFSKSVFFGLGIIIALLILVFVVPKQNHQDKNETFKPTDTAVTEKEPALQEKTKQTDVITLALDGKKIELPILKGQSLYDVLEKAKNQNVISLEGKNYSGLGFFVTDIGSLHTTSDKNLFYYVNEKEAQTGISSYKPSPGDIISWELK